MRASKVQLLLFIASIALSACGGGGAKTNTGGGGVTDPNRTITLGDTTSFTGQSSDLILYFPDEKITNITWSQTSGKSVTLLAKTSKVVSFTPSESGSYSFSVSFSVNDGASQTLTQSIVVDAAINKITTRLSHAVLSDNKVSLRVELNEDIDINSLTWQQTLGPTVTLSETDVTGDLAIFFDAPNVTTDTLITFKVSASDNSQNYSDQVTVLVEPASTIASNAYFDSRVASVFPYQNTSPYADNIVDCVYSNNLSSSCTLNKLPLLAQEAATPSIDNIMDRVVVSHQWMGDKFKKFLENHDSNDDFKNLLRATTAIVISYDIRPSFYWAATGAIYLDAENFWLTPEERDTINEAPDYRAAFGNDLQFVMPWRYVKNNAYASASFSKAKRVTRTELDGLYRLSSLMYHELAHANDFFPSNEWFSHNEQTRVLDAALSTNFESDSLAIALPLQSSEMRNLAQVSFAGNTANNTQKSYLPSDITTFFSADIATDFYAYTSEREDYAMLFEELMMHERFGIERDVAITNQPTGDIVYANDYIVTWGQRGRIGETTIKPRVLFSASRVLPEFNSNSAINALSPPIPMIVGNNWIENLTISTSQKNKIGKEKELISSRNAPLLPPTFERYYQKALPEH
ncbi:MAG: hypothetical protein OCD00_09005 [Colwellia sp.]